MSKESVGPITSWLQDLYLSVLENKDGAEGLVKNVLSALEFFKICSGIVSVDAATGNPKKHNLPVVFNGTEVNSLEDLAKSSALRKIITTLKAGVTEFLKRSTAKNLYINCHSYYEVLKAHNRTLPFNFGRLENLLRIMEEFIQYNLHMHNSFTWAATSFMFHVLYASVTGALIHHHHITLTMEVPKNSDHAESLTTLFRAKRTFLDQFLTEMLPKILSFHIEVHSNQIYFCSKPIDNTEANPILQLIAGYKNSNLTPQEARVFILNHGHNLIQSVRTPTLLAGAPPLPEVGVNPLQSPPKPVLPDALKLPTTTTVKKPDGPNIMPSDKDYEKIMMMKLFDFLERCVMQQGPKTGPKTLVLLNFLSNIKKLVVGPDGIVTIQE